MLICLGVSLSTMAENENAFVVGTEWETLITSTTDPTPSSIVQTASITENAVIDNEEVMKLTFSYNNDSDYTQNNFIYVKNIDSKIYFRLNTDTDSSWYLLYDFGLTPGEGCYVYTPLNLNTQPSISKSYIKCVSVKESNPDFYNLDTMLMEGFSSDACELSLGSGVWITNISSENGVLANNSFDVDGGGSQLLKVTLDDEILYEAPTTKLPSIDSNSNENISISTKGLFVSVSGTGLNSCPLIFTLSGEKITPAITSEGQSSFIVPSAGVYILKAGSHSQKFIVR